AYRSATPRAPSSAPGSATRLAQHRRPAPARINRLADDRAGRSVDPVGIVDDDGLRREHVAGPGIDYQPRPRVSRVADRGVKADAAPPEWVADIADELDAIEAGEDPVRRGTQRRRSPRLAGELSQLIEHRALDRRVLCLRIRAHEPLELVGI